MQSGVREPPLGRFIRFRLCRLPTLVPFSSTNFHPGTGLLPPLGQKIWAWEQGLGLRSSLGRVRARARARVSQGQWPTSLSSREMANPRAGSKAKARSMANPANTGSQGLHSGSTPQEREAQGVG